MNGLDVAVRGDGVVARALALALARQRLRVALPMRSDAPAHDDVRAYALNAASLRLLTELQVWDALPVDARTPVYDMRIEGDTAGAALVFSAWQQRVGELAWIVDAGALLERLAAAVRATPQISVTRDAIEAPLLALAEGRDSAARDQLGVVFDTRDYGQHAIAARLVGDRHHQGIAWQWFRSPDVLALLPFDRPRSQQSYALVWSLPSERAAALLDADAASFEDQLARATGSAAGALRLAGERRSWPLAWARADRVCGPGWVLLGDAAHIVHPLAGQGLNLGLADVAALARVVAAREPWRSIADERLLRRYARERAAAIASMGFVTDGLLRLFAARPPLLRELRNRGFTLLNHAPPIKRWLVSRALDS